MQFEPKSEREILESEVWKKGEYEFEIVSAVEKLSKNTSKPMIELKVKLSNPKGQQRLLTDYLLPQMAKKFRHAANACGLIDKYDSGTLYDSDFVGKKGKLELDVERDKTKRYPDKNVVKDYIVPGASPAPGVGLEQFTHV